MRRSLSGLLWLCGAVFLCLFFFIYSPVSAYASEKVYEEAITNGIQYLSGMQNGDGGFASDKGRTSSQVSTAWAIMALRAAGEDITAEKWVKNGHSPLEYLKSGNSSLDATTDYARTLLALMAGGGSPNYQGINLAEKILSFQQANGEFAQLDKGEKDLINAHIWAILALSSAGIEIPQKDKAAAWLISCQNEDGGFGWVVGESSDPDDTGVAVTALVLLGENPHISLPIQKALAYLHKQQGVDGGFKWTGQKSNTATDSWVIQGLVAAGAYPGAEKWQREGNSPFSHLLSFQNTDGSFNWTSEVRSSPVLMTSYAIMALCKKPLPVNMDFAQISGNTLHISLKVGSKETIVNGRIKFLDTPPVIVNNRTLIPLRFVGEYLGATFLWIPESSRVDMTYGGKIFSLFIGQTSPELDTPAIIEGGRTLVPLRYIAERLGATVNWNEKERRIDIAR